MRIPFRWKETLVVFGPKFRPVPQLHATVVAPGDVFRPFMTVIREGGTVTFTNKDTDLHTVAGTPNSPRRFPASEVALPAGKTATVTFNSPGVYDYYCPIHAIYHAQFQQVGARKGTDAYPVCMQEIVVVVPSR